MVGGAMAHLCHNLLPPARDHILAIFFST